MQRKLSAFVTVPDHLLHVLNREAGFSLDFDTWRTFDGVPVNQLQGQAHAPIWSTKMLLNGIDQLAPPAWRAQAGEAPPRDIATPRSHFVQHGLR